MNVSTVVGLLLQGVTVILCIVILRRRRVQKCDILADVYDALIQGGTLYKSDTPSFRSHRDGKLTTFVSDTMTVDFTERSEDGETTILCRLGRKKPNYILRFAKNSLVKIDVADRNGHRSIQVFLSEDEALARSLHAFLQRNSVDELESVH